MESEYDDMSDYSCVDFDLEEDFLQFLNEARNGKTGANRSVSLPKAEMVFNKGKKTKKSWRALFSWLRVEKKGKDQTEPAGNKNRSYAQKRGHVSGPICRGSRGTEFDGRLLWRMNSASLAGLFSPQKRVENEARFEYHSRATSDRQLSHPPSTPLRNALSAQLLLSASSGIGFMKI